ncbi:MAG: hypothetical protein ACE5IT_00625 [bacterium]
MLLVGLADYILDDYLKWKEASFLKEERGKEEWGVVDLEELMRRLKEIYEPEGRITISKLRIKSEPKYRPFVGGSTRFFLLAIPYLLFLCFRYIVLSIKQLVKEEPKKLKKL